MTVKKYIEENFELYCINCGIKSDSDSTENKRHDHPPAGIHYVPVKEKVDLLIDYIEILEKKILLNEANRCTHP